MYKQTEYQVITDRIKELRKFIQVVMGARQIGKSTVVKQVLQDLNMPYQFFSADNVPATNSAWISDCWAAVRSLKVSRGWESVILVISTNLLLFLEMLAFRGEKIFNGQIGMVGQIVVVMEV